MIYKAPKSEWTKRGRMLTLTSRHELQLIQWRCFCCVVQPERRQRKLYSGHVMNVCFIGRDERLLLASGGSDAAVVQLQLTEAWTTATVSQTHDNITFISIEPLRIIPAEHCCCLHALFTQHAIRDCKLSSNKSSFWTRKAGPKKPL